VKANYSETYTFYTLSDDGVRLWVNNKLVIDNWTDHAPTENRGTIALQAGATVPIKLEYYENGGGAVAKLLWSSPSRSKEVIPSSQLFTTTDNADASSLQIVMFSVDSSDSALIVFPNRKTMLVDSAMDWAFEDDVLPFLRRHEINHLDYYVETHPHDDHIGGRELLHSEGYVDADTTLWDWQTHRYEDSFGLEGAHWFITNAYDPALNGDSINRNSLAFRLEYNDFVYSHGGDQYDNSQRRVLADHPNMVPAHVRNTAHHMYGPVDREFLLATDPYLFIVSNGSFIRQRDCFANTFLPVVDELKGSGGRLIDYLITGEVGHVAIRATIGDVWSHQLCADTNTCVLEDLLQPSDAVDDSSPAPRLPFPQARAFPGAIKPSHLSQQQLNDAVIAYYERWKADHVREFVTQPHGKGYVVAMQGTNGSGSEVTTSEAHGWGMIVSALMAGFDPDARAVFDGFFSVYDAYRSTVDSDLMSWIVDSSGDPSLGGASATDGDLDIAYALLLAHFQWGSDGENNYIQHARRIINDGIKQSEMDASTYRTMLGDWDTDPYSTRSSDWMTGHFRAFYQHTRDPFWLDATQTAYALIDSLASRYAPSTGLMPDFVVANPPSPAAPFFLEAATDGDYSWNACRFPLRIAADYAHASAPAAKQTLSRILPWLTAQTAADPARVRAGYTLAGKPLVTYSSSAFTAPMVAAAIVDSAHQPFLNQGWDIISTAHSGYYGDTITLLSMLLVSGNWWAPDCASGGCNGVCGTCPEGQTCVEGVCREASGGDDDPIAVHLAFEGNLQDSSGAGNDVVSSVGVAYVSGLAGGLAARLGTYDYVSLGRPAALSFGGHVDFSVSLWTRADVAPSADPVMIGNKDWASGNNPGWVVAWDGDGLRWNVKGSAASRADGYDSTDLADGDWHHIVVTFDRDGQSRYFLDGIARAQASIAGAGDIDAGATILGQDATLTYSANSEADYDEVRIFRKVLTPLEIAALFSERDPAGECATSADCNDNVYCNGIETCLDGVCQAADAPCATDESCDEQADTCNPVDLLTHLPLDGDVHDASGHENHGLLRHGGLYESGVVGSQSLRLNTSQYIEFPMLSFGPEQNFSVALWVKVNGTNSGDPTLVGNKDWTSGNNIGWQIDVDRGYWDWNYRGAAGMRLDAYNLGYVADGAWHHIVVSYDRDGNADLYHDGALRESVRIAGQGDIDAGLPLNIGQDGTGTYGGTLDVNIDQVKIFNKAVLAMEVLELFAERP
jgi:endo-1,4-beta-D-glucanase Y